MTKLEAHRLDALPTGLSKLSKQHTPGIIEAIARNPGTPREMLLWLVETHPQAVLENPVLPLLLLETPTLFHELGRMAVYALFGLPSLPTWVLCSHFCHSNGYFRIRAAPAKENGKLVGKMLLLRKHTFTFRCQSGWVAFRTPPEGLFRQEPRESDDHQEDQPHAACYQDVRVFIHPRQLFGWFARLFIFLL